MLYSSTYDHRVWRTGLPVRSAVLKPHAGRLVVWWVTTCESRLLYVFVFFIFYICTFFSRFNIKSGMALKLYLDIKPTNIWFSCECLMSLEVVIAKNR